MGTLFRVKFENLRIEFLVFNRYPRAECEANKTSIRPQNVSNNSKEEPMGVMNGSNVDIGQVLVPDDAYDDYRDGRREVNRSGLP